jgi:hypothetical protein
MLSWLNILIGIAALFAAFALIVTTGTQFVRQVARLKNRFLVERLRRLFGELEHTDRFVAAMLSHPSLEGIRGRTFYTHLVDPGKKQDDGDVQRSIAAVVGTDESRWRLWRHPWSKTEDLDKQTVKDIATAVYSRIGPQVDTPIDRANLGGAGGWAESLSKQLAGEDRESKGVVPFRGKLWGLASAAFPEAEGRADPVKTYVAAFHDEAQASASDSFTYVIRFINVILATLVVFFFGLDAIDIYTRISRTDPARIDSFAQAIQRLEPALAASATSNEKPDRQVSNVRATVAALEQGPICLCFMGRPLTPPLPGDEAAGKAAPPCPKPSPQGFILAVIGLSFGAPFWFEFLKWGINMKSSFTKDSSSGK